MLAPNKQNLLILKNQNTLIASGHKLLKEKRTGLINTFLKLAREGKILEKKVSSEFEKILINYKQASYFVDKGNLFEKLSPVSTVELEITKKRISGVRVENIDIVVEATVNNDLKPKLKTALWKFANFFPELMKLEQNKLTCQKIAQEIHKVNRQINNLDKKIEDIQAQIKQIKQVLQEQSNLEKATLIKIFN